MATIGGFLFGYDTGVISGALLSGRSADATARGAMSATVGSGCAIERLEVGAYTVPTDRPEADGTLAWDSTTIVLVEAHAGGHAGLGWTYAEPAVAALIEPDDGALRPDPGAPGLGIEFKRADAAPYARLSPSARRAPRAACRASAARPR